MVVGIHRTMGSQDGDGGQPLARQGSLYSLTLDQVQNQLGDSGKPLGSMNLDELLKNVWTAESNQGIGMDVENVAPGAGDAISSASPLQRQASVQLSRALSKKTVDEVWRDIQQGERDMKEEKRHQERQPTLGEMTLEDFLVKAGVVAGASLDKKNVVPTIGVDLMAAPQQNFPEQAQWLQYQHSSVQEQQQQAQQADQNMMGVFMPCHPVPQPMVVTPAPHMDAMYPDNQMAVSSPLLGTFSDTQTPRRKRAASGNVLEKTVERRQKRMIKNRESAARSRARKQAYTNELENKVSRLEEENEKLKKQKMASSEENSSTAVAFMELAIQQAKLALYYLEVPVGCVIVKDEEVIAFGRNQTTETRNATRHAEMEAIDFLLEKWHQDGLSETEVAGNFSQCNLYVTCEPCVMCAAALSILGMGAVYYGCANDKFGGCGSILSLHTGSSLEHPSVDVSRRKGFQCIGGIMASEAVCLFRSFYEQGNPNAPKPHRPVQAIK